MKKLLITSLFLGSCVLLLAQKTTKIPNVYKPVRSEMYKKGWIDFNKNGAKDTYEDPTAPIDAYRRPAQSDDTGRKNLPNGDSLRLQTGFER